jgi:hypothetical protein
MSISCSGGMLFTDGITISFSEGGGSWAMIDQASAAPELTIVGNQATVTGDLSNSVGFSRTNGGKSVLIPANYSFEVLVNDVGLPPQFYAGVVQIQDFNNNTFPLGSTTSGFGISPDPSLWSYDSTGQSYIDGTTVANNDVLGIVVRIIEGSQLLLNLYKNGVLIVEDYLANFTGIPGNLISILIGWKFTDPGATVTLRTDPSTFSYGANYANQNGWSA